MHRRRRRAWRAPRSPTLLAARRGEALVLLSTSYLDEAAACDRLVYLDAGRVVATGTPAELRARVQVELYRVWCDGAARDRARRRARCPTSSRCAPAVATRASRSRPSARPAQARVLADLAALAGVRVVESLPLDMEATLLALARGHAA